MKKTVIIISLLLSYTMCLGQFKYKLESDIETTIAFYHEFSINANISNVDFTHNIFDDTQSTGVEQMTMVRSIQGSMNELRDIQNTVIEYPTEIREIVIGIRTAGSPNQPLFRRFEVSSFNDCVGSLSTNTTDFNALTISYFRLARIFTLSELNNFSAGNNEILECEPLELQTLTCGTITNYSVKYALDDNVTREFLPFGNHGNSVTLDRTAIAGALNSNTIKVWLQYTSDVNDISDILTYTFRKCSPLINSFASTDTSCSNTNDGSFTVTFDRPLDTGEVLSTVSLYHDGPDGIINNADDVLIESLFNQTYTGTTYTWPNPLAADTYRLEYQSGGTNSLEEYFPIVINSPTPVTFTAGWTDVDCFGENTGSISITAGGGAGNYDYSINNGASWFPFSGATIHTVTNLVAGNYQVKVRDANNCIAQQ